MSDVSCDVRPSTEADNEYISVLILNINVFLFSLRYSFSHQWSEMCEKSKQLYSTNYIALRMPLSVERFLHTNNFPPLSCCSHSFFMHLKTSHLASVWKVDIFSASIVIQIAQCLEKHSKSGVKWRWNWVCEMYELAECKWIGW